MCTHSFCCSSCLRFMFFFSFPSLLSFHPYIYLLFDSDCSIMCPAGQTALCPGLFVDPEEAMFIHCAYTSCSWCRTVGCTRASLHMQHTKVCCCCARFPQVPMHGCLLVSLLSYAVLPSPSRCTLLPAKTTSGMQGQGLSRRNHVQVRGRGDAGCPGKCGSFSGRR